MTTPGDTSIRHAGRANDQAAGAGENLRVTANHRAASSKAWTLCLTLMAGGVGLATADTLEATGPSPDPAPRQTSTPHTSFTDAMGKSIWGDVYAHPEDWQELSYGDFFSKGWDQSWVSPPTGAGGAPRQGWLLAFEGVFYRLGIGVFGWQHDLAGTGDGYTGTLVNFTPINLGNFNSQAIPAITSTASAPPTPIASIPKPPPFTVCESVPIIIPPGKA